VPAGDIPVNTDHPWGLAHLRVHVPGISGGGGGGGLWPALESSRVDLGQTLKEGGGPRSGFSRHPVLNLLVVGQVTLSVVVLSCAALFWHSLSRMQGMALGFRTENILMMSLDLDLQQYGDERGRQFLDELLQRTAALPGVRFRFGRNGRWIEVVGVAGDGKYVMLAEGPRSYLYLPLAQNYASPITLTMRSAGEPSSLARPVQDVLRRMDPNLPVFNVRTMDRHIRESVFGLMPLRMAATMAAIEGMLGLLLAVMGLYAVVSHAASQRVHEIGVRMAPGAPPRDVLRLVVRRGMRLALIGVGVGLLLAVGAGLALSHVLYGVERMAAGVLAPVAILLLGVAALACYLPASRATRVDAVVALRCE
jgi:hypothetical protein